MAAVARLARGMLSDRVQSGQRRPLMTARASRRGDQGARRVRIVARFAALGNLAVACFDLLRVAAAAGRRGELAGMRLVALCTVAMSGRCGSVLLLVTGAARRCHAA